MSYGCPSSSSVSRINYFSNPDVSVLNKATGTSTEDNAKTIEDNMVRQARATATSGRSVRIQAPLCVKSTSSRSQSSRISVLHVDDQQDVLHNIVDK